MRWNLREALAAAGLAAAVSSCRIQGPEPAGYSRLHSESGINSGKSFEQIIAEMRGIAERNAQLVEVIEYGSSVSGKKLTAVKVQDKTARPAGKPPAVLISEAIHGNEYLDITDRLPDELITKGTPDSGFRKFLARGGIVYFIPIVNPDAYDGRQRENANGQDLNRDFSIKAAGNAGFTQPETKAVSEFIAREAAATGFTLEMSMEYHCCIGGLIHPWAYKQEGLPADALERHQTVGRKVQEMFGYQFGTVREIVGYDAVGGSDDYYFETYGRRAFSFEGGEGTENQNLAKHVEFWNFMFDSFQAGAAAPTVPVVPTAGPTPPVPPEGATPPQGAKPPSSSTPPAGESVFVPSGAQ